MIKLFKIEGGVIREIECVAEQLGCCLPDADWIDAHEPDADERKLLERLLHTDLPESNEVEEIEASARCFVDQAGIHVHSLFRLRPKADTILRLSPAYCKRNG